METTTHDLNMLKEKYKDVKLYKTSDIALATTLMLLNKDLLYIEPAFSGDGKRRNTEIFQFVFKDSDDREDIVLKYSTGSESLKVIPNSFRTTMRYLKGLTKNFSNQ
jgi:hypothetical protein